MYVLLTKDYIKYHFNLLLLYNFFNNILKIIKVMRNILIKHERHDNINTVIFEKQGGFYGKVF